MGAGNGDMEVTLARQLIEAGLDGFQIQCVDINPTMLERGRKMASDNGISDRNITFLKGDFNRWRPNQTFDIIIANHSLHHVLELEDLFHHIHEAMKPDGAFLTTDMIGRNGHLRWPETLKYVNQYWERLKPEQRYNCQLKIPMPKFEDWDCSTKGFEGIRAQDIMPLLVKKFNFEIFVAFGGIIDVFVDRGYGHNLSINSEFDKKLIDEINILQEGLLVSGEIKPTQMLSMLRRNDYSVKTKYWANLTPERSIRHPHAVAVKVDSSQVLLTDEAREEIEKIKKSWSWKITRPLRFTNQCRKKLIRKIISFSSCISAKFKITKRYSR